MKNKVLEKYSEEIRIIIIDGRCAAGKTTLARELEQETDGQTIHMDDFFLPIELRSRERLNEPGGNVHYERFLEEVAKPIKAERDFSYRVFSCKEMDYVGKKYISIDRPIIIEGAYSMHPIFHWEECHDILKVFLDIDGRKQLERIERRNGPVVKEVFEEKWIPLENRYFQAFNLEDKCRLVIKNA